MVGENLAMWIVVVWVGPRSCGIFFKRGEGISGDGMNGTGASGKAVVDW